MQIKTRLVHAESLVHEMRYSRTSHAERLTRKKNTDKRFSCLVTQLIEILIIDFSQISRLAGASKKEIHFFM
jgi:hypothetical protein